MYEGLKVIQVRAIFQQFKAESNPKEADLTGQYNRTALCDELVHLLPIGFMDKPAFDVSFVRVIESFPSWAVLEVFLDAKRDISIEMLNSDVDSGN